MNETIFDYGVTDKEKILIHVNDWNEVEYVKNTGKRVKLRHLYLLFMIRCESDKAKTILSVMLKKTEVLPVV
jgi:hypothetical protein